MRNSSDHFSFCMSDGRSAQDAPKNGGISSLSSGDVRAVCAFPEVSYGGSDLFLRRARASLIRRAAGVCHCVVASSLRDLLSSLNANLHLSLQGTPLSAMVGQAFRAVVKLVRAMCDNGRRINLIGLTGTMLSNDDASALASGLNSLAGREVTLASQVR